MPYNKEFLKSIKGLKPSESIVTVIDTFQLKWGQTSDINQKYMLSVETMSILMALCKRYKIDFNPPGVKGATQHYVDMVWSFTQDFQNIHRKIMYDSKVSSNSDKYFAALFDEPYLSEDDIGEIQELLLRLRQVVDETSHVSQDSKESIFSSITKIEQELHSCAGILLPLYAKAKEIKDAYELVAAISGIVGAAIAKAHALNLLPGKGIAGFLP